MQKLDKPDAVLENPRPVELFTASNPEVFLRQCGGLPQVTHWSDRKIVGLTVYRNEGNERVFEVRDFPTQGGKGAAAFNYPEFPAKSLRAIVSARSGASSTHGRPAP